MTKPSWQWRLKAKQRVLLFWFLVGFFATFDLAATWLELLGHTHTVLWALFLDTLIMIIAVWRIFQVAGVRT